MKVLCMGLQTPSGQICVLNLTRQLPFKGFNLCKLLHQMLFRRAFYILFFLKQENTSYICFVSFQYWNNLVQSVCNGVSNFSYDLSSRYPRTFSLLFWLPFPRHHHPHPLQHFPSPVFPAALQAQFRLCQ